MDSFEFINNYQAFVSEIENIVKPELKEAVERLKKLYPHDIVTPTSWFPKESDARGLVWTLFLNELVTA